MFSAGYVVQCVATTLHIKERMRFCEDIVSKYGSTYSSRYKDGGEAGRRARRRKWKGEGVGGIAPIISCGGPPELKTVICSRIDLSTPPNYQPIISKWTRVHPTPCALKVERDKIACLCLFHSLHVCLTLPFFYSSLSLFYSVRSIFALFVAHTNTRGGCMCVN